MKDEDGIETCPECGDWMDPYVGEDGKIYNVCALCGHRELACLEN